MKATKKIYTVAITSSIILTLVMSITFATPLDGEYLDQRQDDYSIYEDPESYAGLETSEVHQNAQSFIPSLSTLTRATILIDIYDEPSLDLVLSVRESLTGPDLTSALLNLNDLPYQCETF